MNPTQRDTINMDSPTYRHLRSANVHPVTFHTLEHAFTSTTDPYDFLDLLKHILNPEDLFPSMSDRYESLRDRASDLETQAADWKAEVAGLKAQVKSLEVEVTTLNRDKRFLSELVAELQPKIHDLQNQLTTKEDQP